MKRQTFDKIMLVLSVILVIAVAFWMTYGDWK